jgi:hypothetical protein
VYAVIVAVFVFFAPTTFTSATFVDSGTSGTNVASTDGLTRYFTIVPGTATRPGTATPVAVGSNETISFDLGRVPDSHIFNDVARITNVDSVSRSLDLSTLGTLTPIIGWEFSDGTTTKSFAPGATWQLRARTDAAAAGPFSGFARFELSGDSFLRLDRGLDVAQAPNPPTGVTIDPPDGTAHAVLNWTASTSTGVAGYNVYRATAAGGPYTKINATPVAGTSYDDTSATLGADYWYRVRAVASGVSPELDGLDSNTAFISVLAQPTAVYIPASANNTLNWVSLATRANVTFSIDVPAGTAAGDVVRLTATQGANNINLTQVAAGGAQTLNFTGNNLTTWANGPIGTITMTARIERGTFVSPTTGGAAGKDVTLPAAPTAASIPATASNPVNYVNSVTQAAAGVRITSTAGATDTVEARLTSAGVPAYGTAAGGASPVTVPVNASTLADTAVGGLQVAARVVDIAGNPSAWFIGTAATKDTVAPNNPNVTLINFTNRFFGADRVRGNAGALSGNAQVRIFDYWNNTYYPTGGGGWVNGNGAGAFPNTNIAAGGTPRTLGFESRDAAWNVTARVCGRWNASGAGTAVACP